MFKPLLITLSISLYFVSDLCGQQLLGLANSNYSGVHGIYSNPASIADSRFRFSLNALSFDGNASNNYVRYNGPKSLFQMIKDDEAFTEENLEAVPGNKPKLFNTSLDFRGPAVMFTMGPKNSIALSSRVRGALQINNISGNLAELIRTGGESDDLLNQLNKDNQLSLMETFRLNLVLLTPGKFSAAVLIT